MYNDLPQYSVCADNGEIGPNGFLKLQGYHELICDLIEQNEIANGSSIAETIKQGFAWAITSLSLDVKTPVSNCEWMLGQTWLSEIPDGIIPYYRREVQFFRKDGEHMFSASLYLVRLDISTHKILDRVPDESEKAAVKQYGTTVDCAVPRIRDRGEFELLHTRQVYPSDIDALGHLNNCRYGAMVFDAAAAKGLVFTSAPFRYIINFVRQTMPDKTINVFTRLDSDRFCVCGSIEGETRRNFIAYVMQ